jgi:hypothetical protein
MVHILRSDKMKLLGVNTMSRKTDNLMRIIQDLESRYGKGDPHVQQLQIKLSALEALEEACRRRWRTPAMRKPEIRLAAS